MSRKRHQDDADEGVPVWEAMERWVPPELWQRYKQIATDDTYQVYVFGRGGPVDPQKQEASKLKAQIMKILTERLVNGELVASGIESPVRDIGKPRQDIAADLWSFLYLNLFRSEAQGEGIKLIALRIRSVSGDGPPGEVGSLTNSQDERSAARRGPGSLMPLIKAEMIERARRGELRPTIADESRVLERWAREHHQTFVRPPKAKSIREALRETYNQLKAGKGAGI